VLARLHVRWSTVTTKVIDGSFEFHVYVKPPALVRLAMRLPFVGHRVTRAIRERVERARDAFRAGAPIYLRVGWHVVR